MDRGHRRPLSRRGLCHRPLCKKTPFSDQSLLKRNCDAATSAVSSMPLGVMDDGTSHVIGTTARLFMVAGFGGLLYRSEPVRLPPHELITMDPGV